MQKTNQKRLFQTHPLLNDTNYSGDSGYSKEIQDISPEMR